MTEIVKEFIEKPLLSLIEFYQDCLRELEVSCSATEKAIKLTKSVDSACKISGSGLREIV
ncbi:MAG: hypothetical protein RCG15_00350 [Candidatus Rickettsia vulgarisii]